MNSKQVQSLINKTAKAVRQEIKKYKPTGTKPVEINYGLPYVAITLLNEEYFFQGEEASTLLDEAKEAANKFNTNVENALLWLSQSW